MKVALQNTVPARQRTRSHIISTISCHLKRQIWRTFSPTAFI